MVRVSSALLAFILGASVSTASLAATVNVLQGQVLLSRGEGYQLVDGSTEAAPGNTVVVNPGGIAQIVYPDGCMVQVKPPAVVTIAPQSPAKRGSHPRRSSRRRGAAGHGGDDRRLRNNRGKTAVVGGGLAAVLILLNLKDKPAAVEGRSETYRSRPSFSVCWSILPSDLLQQRSARDRPAYAVHLLDV
jgi:hypothetical protein